MNKELTYWLALAHVPKIQTKKKNEIIVRLFEKGKSIIDFFEFEQSGWENDYELSQSEIVLFEDAKEAINLCLYGWRPSRSKVIISQTSQDYSQH